MAKITLAELRDLADANPQGYIEAFGDNDPLGIAPSLRERMAQPAANDAEPEKSSLLRRTVADPALALAKGVIAVPEAAVGLANIPTMGYAGKAAEAVGIRFADAKNALTDLMSPEARAAQQKVDQAEGVIDTTIAAIQNPSTIVNAVAESLPSVGAGGVAGRGLAAIAPRLGLSATAAETLAAAGGEGIVGAGSAAEGIRQQTEDGTLTGGQAGLATLSGISTAAFGALGSKVARSLGITDVDGLAAGVAGPAVTKGFVRRVLEGAASEGLLEELPQSVSEQVLQNAALGRPLDEGVDQAAVLGTLAGGLMGAGANALSRPGAPPAANPAPAPAPPAPGLATASPGAPAPAAAQPASKPKAAKPAPAAAPAPPAAAAPFDPATATDLPPVPPADSLTFNNDPPRVAPPAAAGPDLENFGNEELPADAVRRQLLAEQGLIERNDGAFVNDKGETIANAEPFRAFLAQADEASADLEAQGLAVTPDTVREELRRRQKLADLQGDRDTAQTPEAKAVVQQQIDAAIAGASAPAGDLEALARTAENRGDKDAAKTYREAIKGLEDGTVADRGSESGSADLGGSLEDAAGAGQIPGGNQGAADAEATAPSGGSGVAVEGGAVQPAAGIEADPLQAAAFDVIRSSGKSISGLQRKLRIGYNRAASLVEQFNADPANASPAADQSEISPPDRQAGPRRGEVGGKLAAGEVVTTATGRSTTPFPKIDTSSERKAGNTFKRVDEWLMQNALAEAEARGDEFNAQSFRQDLKNPPPASKDSAEEYLFGDTIPPVLPSILKPLAGKDGPKITTAKAGEGATAIVIDPAPMRDADAPSKRFASITDLPSLRKAVQEWAKGWLLKAKRISNPDPRLGEIILSYQGVKHGLSGPSSRAKILSVEMLPDLLESAQYVKSEGDKKNPESGDRFHYAEAMATVEGGKYRARLVIRERKDGKKYYDHDLSGLEPGAKSDGAQGTTDQRSPGSVGEGSGPAPDTGAGDATASGKEGSSAATAPEHNAYPSKGASEADLKAIVQEFNDAQAAAQSGDQVTHVFDPPAKKDIVRLHEKAKVQVNGSGWMTVEEAKAKVAEWKAHAKAQGADPKSRSANSEKVVLSLFDLSGEWSQPWEDAGYQVYRFDIQDDPENGDVTKFSVESFMDTFSAFEGQDIHAILAACPCTDFAVSGARHFAAKDADGRTVSSVKLVHQTLATIEFFKPAVWAIENPVGRIESLTGLPPWRLSFDPNHFGDPYTKKTLLWGRFDGNLPIAAVEPTEGSKMHKLYGGKSQATKNARSVTPEGFAYSFFMANNAIDNPLLAVAGKYDRLDRGAIQGALDAGLTPSEIDSLVEDPYYMDLDDEAANAALRDAAKPPPAPKQTKPTEKPSTPAAAPPAAEKPSDYGASNKLVSKDRAAELRDRLKAKLGQVNSGIDPEILAIGTELAVFHIEAGARKFADFAKAVAADLDMPVSRLRGYLRGWYNGARDMMEDASVSIEGMDSPDAVRAELAKLKDTTDEQATPEPEGDRGSEGRVPASEGRREPPAQQPDAPVDSADLGAGQPGDVGAADAAGDRGGNGVRGAGEDVGQEQGAAGRGDAGDGRAGAGRAGAPDAGTGTPGASGERNGRSIGSGELAAGKQGDGGEVSSAPEVVKPPENVSPANAGPGDFSIADPLAIVGGGQVARFDKNRAAIELRNKLIESGRRPTREEQATLAGYTGWGSFGQELFQGTWGNPKPKTSWEKRDQWLRDNLGQSDWEGAQRSIINAHYTDPPTVLAMWDMAQRMGFKGGRVLEPSIGIGNFFGMMPVELASRSRRAGIELDPITGSMAQMLYPEANIRIQGFQDSRTPDNFYDLIIGNWPFDETSPADRRYNRLSPTLHDYFFLKALDQARPGGLVIGITSKGTMDKKSIAARAEMARKGELVAAFRLPSGAFEEYAGTKVVTDIIILRKRETPIELVDKESWINVRPMNTPAGTPVDVNEYFHANPSHVIGTIDYGHGTTTFRPGQIVHRPADMAEQLKRIATLVPEGTYVERAPKAPIAYIANHTNDRTNSLIETKDGLFVVQGDYLAPANQVAKFEVKSDKETAKRKAQLSALITMRKQYGALIDAERTSEADAERKALRKSFEAFNKAHGRLGDSFGLSYLGKIDDPFYPALAALEIKGADGKIKPAKVLTESTTRGARKIENPSITDAFVLARNKATNPNIEDIAALSGVPVDEARTQLIESGAAFELPNGDFVPSDMYLAGNVREKLRQAKAGLEAGNESMKRNIEALTKVLPETVPYYSIETQLGATWVPPKVYQQYVAHLLGMDSDEGIEASFKAGAWEINFPPELNHRPQASSGYGTRDVRFKRLVRSAIANQLIKVKKKNSDGSEYVDDKATAAANDAISRMRRDFGAWLWSDAVRRTDLEAEYNEVRNAYASPVYDGSFLAMEGMALTLGRGPFNLRQHQVDAIWRGIVTRKSLNAHEVGTGKTFTMGGIAVESRRYGIAKKPLILAHNANSKSVAHEIQMMYPAANVLYLDNLSKENVKVRMMQIANDDWDAVVIPHSMIDRLGFKEETLTAMAQEQITELEIAAEDAAKEDNVTITGKMWDDPEELKKLRSATAKQLVKQRQKIIEQIKKLAQRASKDGAIAFEDLGIDMVIVDEAHEFKKPPIATKMKMKGLQTQTSDRSISLMFMTAYVRAQQNGGNVHLFTGTPITNTLTEVFHQMRYIMGEEMKAAGIADWDGWFGSFAQEEEDVELTSSGDYEAVTRLQNFINVPELRRMIGQYMDVVFADDMPEMQPRKVNGKMLNDPTLTDDERNEILYGRTENAPDRPYKKVISVSADMSPQQLAVFEHVKSLSAAWKLMKGKTRREAMARGAPEVPIIHDALAEKASFDIRLVNGIQNAGREGEPDMDPHPDSKPARAVRNLLEIYKGSSDASQVVFMEQGMSKTVTRSEGEVGAKVQKTYPSFSTMLDMVERLVQGGVPREQIAVVTGATSKDKRKEIADAMNSGKVRIVFGSTDSLGVGVNMQRNLRAMHHLDAPWMPGELEQRNGRGHRQGNQWNTVFEFRYLTDRIDGRRWQVLAIKQRFITAFLKSKGDVRIIEGDAASDEQGDIMSTFAEAAGDPRVLVRAKYQKKLDAMQQRERLHGEAVAEATRKAGRVRDFIAGQQRALADMVATHIPKVAELLESQRGEGFKATINGKDFTDKDEADTYLERWLPNEIVPGMRKPIGKYRDIALFAEQVTPSNPPRVFIKIADRDFQGASLSGLETSMRYFRDNTVKRLEQDIRDDEEDLKQAVKVSKDKFPMQEKLDDLITKVDAIEKDLARNPVAPPYWLRTGAPMDTLVSYKGKEYVVNGHRWTSRGWFVVGQIGEQREIQIPYLEALDAQGMPLYEEREFKKPTVMGKDGKPVDLADEPEDVAVRRDATVPRLDMAGRQLRQAPAVAFSRGSESIYKASAAQVAKVEQMVSIATKAWANAPRIVVLDSMQDAKAPEAAREADANQKANGAEGEPLGFIYQGVVYINAGTARNPKVVLHTLHHEALGHFGLRSVFGNRLNDELKKVALLRAKDVNAKIIDYGYARDRAHAKEILLDEGSELTGAELDAEADKMVSRDRLRAAEEVLARMAEDNPQLPLVQRVLAAIRSFLRPIFQALRIELELTDAELIRDYLIPARDYVRQGSTREQAAGVLAFGRQTGRIVVNRSGQVAPLFGQDASRSARRGEVILGRSEKGWTVVSRGGDIHDRDVRRAQLAAAGERIAFSLAPDATIARRMGRFVDEFLAHKVRDTDVVVLGDTPLALRAAGAPKMPLEIDGAVLRKALEGKHAAFGITADMLKALPAQLEDPALIFRSATQANSLLVVTQMADRMGNPVAAAVHLSKRSGRLVVNRIESVHSRENGESRMVRDAENGLLAYYNDEALARPTTVPLYLGKVVQAAQGPVDKVVRRSDLVNADPAAGGVAFSRSAGYDIDRVWRDLTFSHKFSDFGTDTESKAAGSLDDFVISRSADNAWVGLNVVKDRESGMYSASLESGRFPTGTGAATTMYLEALNVAQKRGLGWTSEGVRSDQSIAIYRRLKSAGVPFAANDGLSSESIPAERLAKVDLQAVADRLARGRAESVDFSRSSRNAHLAQTWEMPPDTRVEKFLHAIQDKNIDLKAAIRSITDAGRTVADGQNAYQVEELSTSRKAQQAKDFMENEVKPVLQAMNLNGVKLEELEEYLHARHAKEANERIAEINDGNPDLQDGGSGMTTDDAKALLDSLSADERQRLDNVARMIDRLQARTRQYLVDAGIETAETVAEWEATYDHYVPLMREGYEDQSGRGGGQGISAKGDFAKTRLGSKRRVVDIFANVVMAREKAINRAENARVGRSLLGLAIQNENPEFWLPVNPDIKTTPARSRKLKRELMSMGLNPADADGVAKEPVQRYLNPQTGLVESRINPALRSRDNVIAVRVNGKDRFLFLSESDPRAVRMASALKNLDARQMSAAMRSIGAITRFFAAVNTQFNVIFGQVNFLRDVQSALLNLGDTPIKGQKAALANEARRLYAATRGGLGTMSKLTGADAALWQEFREAGGTTGFRDVFPSSTERTKAIKHDLDPSAWADGKWGKVFTANGTLKVPLETGRRWLAGGFRWISDYNEALENVTRLAAFKVALDNGMSTQQAASLAKNLTANFNRRGEWSQSLGSFYAFFNAGVQGSTRIAQALLTKNANGDLRLSNYGKTVVLGGVSLGILQAVAMAAAGYGDDEPPEFVRERNLILPDFIGGTGKYITIPMPLGWHVLPNLGRKAAELVMKGGEGKVDAVIDMLRVSIDAFNPMGSGTVSQMLSPTAADPIVALGENADFTGKPIAREDRSSLDPTPGFTRGRDSASFFGEGIAYALNLLTGGTDYTPGKLSPTPDQIDYLAGQIGGGVAREVIKGVDSMSGLIAGTEVPIYRVPLAGRFVGSVTGQASESDRFYRNVTKINLAEREALGRKGDGEAVDGFLGDHPEARLGKMADKAQQQVSKMRKLKREELAQGASLSDVAKYDEAITKLQKQLNDAVAQAKR